MKFINFFQIFKNSIQHEEAIKILFVKIQISQKVAETPFSTT